MNNNTVNNDDITINLVDEITIGLIDKIYCVCQEFETKDRLNGRTHMKKIFELVHQVKCSDPNNVSTNLKFIKIVYNYDFSDKIFIKCKNEFGSCIEDALSDFNLNESYASLEPKSQFCICWEKNPDEYLIFGTSYLSGLSPNQIYKKTLITVNYGVNKYVKEGYVLKI